MNITQKALNYLKAISAETISNAKSGHLGVTLGASSILFAFLRITTILMLQTLTF